MLANQYYLPGAGDPHDSRQSVVRVGFRVPQTLERFKLWGACEELNLPSLPTRRSHSLARLTQRKRGHDSLPSFGPPCGVKPYSCFVVDWPWKAEDELVQWENNHRRCVLELQ